MKSHIDIVTGRNLVTADSSKRKPGNASKKGRQGEHLPSFFVPDGKRIICGFIDDTRIRVWVQVQVRILVRGRVTKKQEYITNK